MNILQGIRKKLRVNFYLFDMNSLEFFSGHENLDESWYFFSYRIICMSDVPV